jgi:hypothetical protein
VETGGTGMLIRANYTYPPELMEAMKLAFHRACKALQLSDRDDAFTDIVATRIVELAKTGERDPDRLCGQVLEALSEKRAASNEPIQPMTLGNMR